VEDGADHFLCEKGRFTFYDYVLGRRFIHTATLDN
jgi:hypothetical protein